MRRLMLVIATLLAFANLAHAQTAHGVLVTWTTPTVPSGGAAVAGINLFRATYSAGACGTYAQLNTTPVAGTSYNDPSAGLLVGTEYCYYATTQDVNGNLSGPSNVATVTTPAAWPVNPNAPSVTVKVQ